MCSSTPQQASPGPSEGGAERKASSGVYSSAHPHSASPPHEDEIEAIGLATGPADEIATPSATASLSSSAPKSSILRYVSYSLFVMLL